MLTNDCSIDISMYLLCLIFFAKESPTHRPSREISRLLIKIQVQKFNHNMIAQRLLDMIRSSNGSGSFEMAALQRTPQRR